MLLLLRLFGVPTLSPIRRRHDPAAALERRAGNGRGSPRHGHVDRENDPAPALKHDVGLRADRDLTVPDRGAVHGGHVSEPTYAYRVAAHWRVGVQW